MQFAGLLPETAQNSRESATKAPTSIPEQPPAALFPVTFRNPTDVGEVLPKDPTASVVSLLFPTTIDNSKAVERPATQQKLTNLAAQLRADVEFIENRPIGDAQMAPPVVPAKQLSKRQLPIPRSIELP
jgi:hypothetical protein